MEPESSLPHSQVPATCPYLSLITTASSSTCKHPSSPKYVFIWLCLIMTRKNFSLLTYLMSVLRFYYLIISESLQMCAANTLIGNMGME